MVYSEILVNTKPWAYGSVLVGLVAEDPKSGKVRIVRAKLADGDPRELSAVDRFLASLEALAKLMNAGKARGTVASVLKHVPDRGTSFQLSSPRSGEFTSTSAALRHCLEKRTGSTVSQPRRATPIGPPITAR